MNGPQTRRIVAHAVMTALLLHLSNPPWFYPSTVLLLASLGSTAVARTVFTEQGGVHFRTVHMHRPLTFHHA